MSRPRKAEPVDVTDRKTARANDFRIGDRVWYRQTTRGGYGFTRFIPGVFDCYGAVRCAVTVADAVGGFHRVWVDPRNVFERWPQDGGAMPI